MAVIGEALFNPEFGWKRYDNRYPSIVYEGNWNTTLSDSNYWNGDENYSNDIEARIKFNFLGTKIRLIANIENNKTNEVEIIIDGISYTYSQYNQTLKQRTLIYENINLDYGIHSVIIKKKNTDSLNFSLDALDINFDGRLLHPEEVLHPSDIEIGKRIRCHYLSSTNQIGFFSNLGEETFVDGTPEKDFIPLISDSSPNGDFYFICVDYDYLDRAVLIADRNIQCGISWNTINAAGFVNSGREINIGFNDYLFSIRLLTGGKDVNDTNNEWYKYIITGNNATWNWSGIYSWTSTVFSGFSGANRVRRGNTSNEFSNASSSIVNNTTGFRPILLVKRIDNYKYLIRDADNLIKTLNVLNNEWQSLSTVLTEDLFLNQGLDNLYILTKIVDKGIVSLNDDGEIGQGKQFSCDLTEKMKTILGIIYD